MLSIGLLHVKVFIKVGLFRYAEFEGGSLVHEFLEDCGLGSGYMRSICSRTCGLGMVGGGRWWRNYGLWADHLRPNPTGRIRCAIYYWFVVQQIIFKWGVDRSRFGKQLRAHLVWLWLSFHNSILITQTQNPQLITQVSTFSQKLQNSCLAM